MLLLPVCLLLVLALRYALVRSPEQATSPRELEPHIQEFAIFNTYGRITVYADAARVPHAFRRILDEMRVLHNTINRFDPDSELSRLNRSAHAQEFPCSEPLWDILLEARRAHDVSDGAFDVSVGPLMALWGFHRKRSSLPTADEISDALEKVGLQKVIFDDAAHRVRFSVPGMSLDFGGIAKGYALDRVVQCLRENNITRGLVDLGGNICCLPEPPPARAAYQVGIRNPFDTNSLLGRVRLLNRAVATSGNYERYVTIEGRTISHIIDPRSGQPVSEVHSVTAITPRGVDSDILSTACFVSGSDQWETIADRIPGASIIRVELAEDGRAKTRTWGHARLLPP